MFKNASSAKCSKDSLENPTPISKKTNEPTKECENVEKLERKLYKNFVEVVSCLNPLKITKVESPPILFQELLDQPSFNLMLRKAFLNQTLDQSLHLHHHHLQSSLVLQRSVQLKDCFSSIPLTRISSVLLETWFQKTF